MTNSRSKAHTGGKLVMVADQNEKDNLLICDMLEEQGYGTVPVFEFTSARQLLSDMAPDLIVLDSSFQHSDEIITMTREQEHTRAVPIVLIRHKYRRGASRMIEN